MRCCAVFFMGNSLLGSEGPAHPIYHYRNLAERVICSPCSIVSILSLHVIGTVVDRTERK